MVDLVHVQHTYGVHASTAVDAGYHWLLIDGVILHLFEDVLWNDSGCERVIANCHLVRGDHVKTLWTVDISRGKEKYEL